MRARAAFSNKRGAAPGKEGAKGVVLVSMQIRLAKGVGDGCGGCIC